MWMCTFTCVYVYMYVGLFGYVCECMFAVCAHSCGWMCMHVSTYACVYVCMYSSQKTNVIPVNKWNRTNKVWVERTWEQMRVKYSETWWDDYLPGIMALFTNHKSLMVLKNFAMSFICTGFSYTISMYLQGTNQLSNFAQIQWVKILTPSCSYILERLFLTTIYDQTDLI